MSRKKTEGPATLSPQYEAMAGQWDKVSTVLAGTEAMRAAGRRFLPQHSGEENFRYAERLSRTTLWNQAELTLNSWVGRPFSEPIKVGDSVPDAIKDILSDVDLEGTSLDVFCQEWFRSGVSKAFCHVMVDFPVDDGSRQSRADDVGLRPYLTLIQPENVLSSKAVRVGGKEVLEYIRIWEIVQETDPEDPWKEIEVPQIRVMSTDPYSDSPVEVSVYRMSSDKRRKDWTIVESFQMRGMSQIPIVTFYADKKGFHLGKSPLLDLVDMNIAHWQSDSDQTSCLTIARFPILAASGVEDTDSPEITIPGDAPGATLPSGAGRKQIVIGPFSMLSSADPQGKFYYVEHTGAALEAGAKSLQHLEERMKSYGTEFLKKSPDRMTATARMLDSNESISPLQAMALQFRSALHEVMKLVGKWMNIEESNIGEFDIVTDFGVEELSQMDLDALNKARDRGDISRSAYLKELKLRGILSEDYDIDGDLGEIDEESMILSMGNVQDFSRGSNRGPVERGGTGPEGTGPS